MPGRLWCRRNTRSTSCRRPGEARDRLRLCLTIPIKLGDVRDEEFGDYDGSAVVLTSRPIRPNRGVLIHELLRAFNDQERDKDETGQLGTWNEKVPRRRLSPNRARHGQRDGILRRHRVDLPLRQEFGKPHDRPAIRAVQPGHYKFLGCFVRPERANSTMLPGR